MQKIGKYFHKIHEPKWDISIHPRTLRCEYARRVFVIKNYDYDYDYDGSGSGSGSGSR